MSRNGELTRIDPELKKILEELKADLEISTGRKVSFIQSSSFLAKRIKRRPKEPLLKELFP